ncbi:MAG: phosphatase PAP2 family protein [Pseudomonadota bacterium]
MRVIDNIQEFDRRMLLLLQHSQSWLAKRRRIISRSADGYLYVIIGGVVSSAWEKGGDLFLAHIAAAFALERVSYWILKNGLRRRRPSDALPEFKSQITAADEFSFPSGHTSAAFLFVTLLVLHFGPLLLPLYIWSMAVAMSRVYLGVHFPTDTAMGAVLGTSVALSTAYWLF